MIMQTLFRKVIHANNEIDILKDREGSHGYAYSSG